MTNELTLFSNGIGHFVRSYNVPESLNVKLSFRKEHLADVIASLQLFGNVKYSNPPTYKVEDDNCDVSIASDNYLKMLRKFSGADISVYQNGTSIHKCVGKLIGAEEVSKEKNRLIRQVFVQLAQGPIQIFDLDYFFIEFTDDEIDNKIKKALASNLNKVNPDKVVLNIDLKSHEGSVAYLQYTMPVASWKMRYVLRKNNKGLYTLEGSAIIDNNTEEDWENFQINAVVGSPVSFLTDLALIKSPQRKFVALVDEEVASTFDVPVTTGYPPSTVSLMGFASSSNISPGVRMGRGITKSCAAESTTYSNAPLATVQEEFEIEEVGDFSVFRSIGTVSIQAHQSAIVPMFVKELSEAETVLIFNRSKCKTIPYRAVRIGIQGLNLGKGKCTIYDQDTFMGEVVLESLRQGEKRILPHALESGVQISTSEANKSETISSEIGNGIFYRKYKDMLTTKYVVVNNKQEDFLLCIDHLPSGRFQNPVFEVTSEVKWKDRETVENKGERITFKVSPKQRLEFEVIESCEFTKELVITTLKDVVNYISICRLSDAEAEKILNSSSLKEISLMADRITSLEENIVDMQDSQTRLSNTVDNIRRNIESLEGSHPKKDTWIESLDDYQKKYTLQEDKLEEMKKDCKKLSNAYKELIKSLSLKL